VRVSDSAPQPQASAARGGRLHGPDGGDPRAPTKEVQPGGSVQTAAAPSPAAHHHAQTSANLDELWAADWPAFAVDCRPVAVAMKGKIPMGNCTAIMNDLGGN
jgi:hypothetical protein